MEQRCWLWLRQRRLTWHWLKKHLPELPCAGEEPGRPVIHRHRRQVPRPTGRGGAAALLRTKVEKGGQGVWGAVPMPAMAYLPTDDVQAIVNWIVKLP